MVVPFILSLIKFFLACSMPFLMAIGTSRALPMPKPAWPCLSPTTTSAEKLRFLPPLTTLVTRLMATTSSFNSAGLTESNRRTARLSLRICFDIGLELYPRFPRRICERLHAAVILVSAAIKHDLFDSGSFGAFGNCFADHFGCRDVSTALERFLGLAVIGAGGDERLAGTIVNDLGVDVADGAVHAKARTIRSADHCKANALMNALALCRSR